MTKKRWNQKERNQRSYDKRKEIINRIKNRPCMDCGGWYEPCQMDFDHREPNKKRGSVSRTLNFSIKALYAEIAKCDVVCSNCHRLRTYVNDKSL